MVIIPASGASGRGSTPAPFILIISFFRLGKIKKRGGRPSEPCERVLTVIFSTN